jgi:hypothetical protein
MDCHTLRTTFVTRLSINKVHPRLAMELARYSDLKLTIKATRMSGRCHCVKSWPRYQVLVIPE